MTSFTDLNNNISTTSQTISQYIHPSFMQEQSEAQKGYINSFRCTRLQNAMLFSPSLCSGTKSISHFQKHIRNNPYLWLKGTSEGLPFIILRSPSFGTAQALKSMSKWVVNTWVLRMRSREKWLESISAQCGPKSGRHLPSVPEPNTVASSYPEVVLSSFELNCDFFQDQLLTGLGTGFSPPQPSVPNSYVYSHLQNQHIYKP